MGADVVKVETPSSGDPGRTTLSTAGRDSNYFLQYNANKRSVAVNLKDPRGVELVKAMARQADVMIENFAPGAVERLAGCGKSRRSTASTCHSQKQPRRGHARRRSRSRRDVQLHSPGATRAGGSPAAADPGDGGRGAAGAVGRVRSTLSQDWAPIDPAREAAAGIAAAAAVLGAERTAADGAVGLQPALPLVRRPEHG